jgi:hypothetical protein
MVPTVKDVTTPPVVLLVVTVPPVTISVPAALRSDPKRTVQVTDGEVPPTMIARISANTMSVFAKKLGPTSLVRGFSTNKVTC